MFSEIAEPRCAHLREQLRAAEEAVGMLRHEAGSGRSSSSARPSAITEVAHHGGGARDRAGAGGGRPSDHDPRPG